MFFIMNRKHLLLLDGVKIVSNIINLKVWMFDNQSLSQQLNGIGWDLAHLYNVTLIRINTIHNYGLFLFGWYCYQFFFSIQPKLFQCWAKFNQNHYTYSSSSHFELALVAYQRWRDNRGATPRLSRHLFLGLPRRHRPSSGIHFADTVVQRSTVLKTCIGTGCRGQKFVTGINALR